MARQRVVRQPLRLHMGDDLRYMAPYSFWPAPRILVRTIPIVLRGNGPTQSREPGTAAIGRRDTSEFGTAASAALTAGATSLAARLCT